MVLPEGTRLGVYEVHSLLGAGGMGEVYLARDPKLDRQVAIKVLPDEMTRDPERTARFDREAKLLASLSHPNIAAIHGFDEARDTRFLVMEFVDGESLNHRLKRGAMPVDDALEVGRQIAEALEAAHEKGVIHRDLKPGNVMVTLAGDVKVLDFGLAKALTDESSEPADEMSPTITANYTRPGVVLGTAAYMSPEQARGRMLDKRTDIWSFGCVLFESLTGKPTFEGQTTSDVIARILEREPDMSALPQNTPPKIVDLLRRCLEKSQKRRLRDIGDAVLELNDAIESRSWTTSAVQAATARARRPMRPGVVAVSLLIALFGVLTGWVAGSRTAQNEGSSAINSRDPVMRLSISLPAHIRSQTVRISPQGDLIAAVGRQPGGDSQSRSRIFTRWLDDFEFRPLQGTDGATNFCFSPDGKWIAFTTRAERIEEGLELSKTPVDGSTAPLHLSAIDREWLSDPGDSMVRFFWNSRNHIVMTDMNSGSKRADRIMRISATTGEATIDYPDDIDDRVMVMTPFSEARGFASLFDASMYADGAWRMGIMAQLDDTREFNVLTMQGSYGTVTSSGHLVYSRRQKLHAVLFDKSTLSTQGGPVAMIDGLRTTNSWENGEYQLSHNGTILYLPGGRVGTNRHLTIANSDGTLTDLAHAGRPMEVTVSASRDGRHAIVSVVNSTNLYELWITAIDAPRLRRFAADDNRDCRSAIWSRDGSYVYYVVEGAGENTIYRKKADGTGKAEQWLRTTSILPLAFTPDDRHMVVQQKSDDKSDSIGLVALGSDGMPVGEPTTVLGETFDTAGADLSPNGEWLVYGSRESGRYEVYLRSFDADAGVGIPLALTTRGGRWPRWSPDGDRIYYWQDQRIMAMGVDERTGTMAGTPAIHVDLETHLVASDGYSPMPGGRLLLIRKGSDEVRPTHAEVVLNWFTELSAKVPVAGQ